MLNKTKFNIKLDKIQKLLYLKHRNYYQNKKSKKFI